MTDSPDPEFPTENTPPLHSILDRYCSRISPAEIHPGSPPTPEEAAKRVYKIEDGELPPNFPRGSKKNFFADTTYLSFGNEGTTATITENGQHMQISQYLANGQSSMYTIDLDGTCEPALGTQRRSDLLEMSEYQYGFGADINIDFDSVSIEMTTGWLRNRWPRVLFEEKKKWKLVQQWVVWRGVVIQQLVLHNLQDKDLEVECVIKTGILIRDADFVNITREFNKEETDNYEEGNAGGYGFVKVHALPNENTREKGDAVAAVMGLFINGEVIPSVGSENGITRLVPKNSQFQLVCGYKLVFLPHDDSDWKRLVITAQDVDIDQFLSETQIKNDIPKDEFLFDREFYIGRNVEHILSVCMIPVAQREVSKGEEVIALTCGDMSGHRVCVSASL
ncbi:hypothetical protein N7520_008665 [Penicillium odoratum]|uniref:uncharacterized protein n=1 Tax=Penicillium odoratum TaxID=1167516 RepID=UPI00254709D3|nr:uncharacterized protein N7520_008665 [Penicillium odoratum]KAJ5751748.1 hypothetical protein N7520_008665 [Penicillium odoratum]